MKNGKPGFPHRAGAPIGFRLAGLGATWLRLAPWILATWLVAVLVPGPAGRQLLVVAGASVFLVAAAARAQGLHGDRPVHVLAVDRALTHLTNLFLLLVLSAFGAAIGSTAGAMIADGAGLSDARWLALPLAGLATVPILWWHWPAAVLSYLVPEEAGYRRSDNRAWRGPRYGHARRLVQAAGSSANTALILGLFYLWLALVVAAAHYRGDAPLFDAVQAASYIVFLPLVLWMAVVEARRMLAALEAPTPPGDGGIAA